MRICLATTHYTPVTGGISLYYTCLSRLLTEAGHSVILLTTGNGDHNADDSIEEEGLFTKITLNAGYQRYLRYYNAYFRPDGYAAGKWIATGMAMREWLVKNAVAFQIDLIETMDFGGAGIFLKHTPARCRLTNMHRCCGMITWLSSKNWNNSVLNMQMQS